MGIVFICKDKLSTIRQTDRC